MAKPKPILHLAAPAGSCRGMLDRLGCASAAELVNLIQTMVGPAYRVTGNAGVIEAPEDDERGGRTDDARRAADLQRALGNDRVAAVVTLRGGAWLTRILPRINFDALRQRTTRVAVFGFSELTTVINIASCYPRAVCWYDMGPAFIPAGLSRYARPRVRVPHPCEARVGDGRVVGDGPGLRDGRRTATGGYSANLPTATAVQQCSNRTFAERLADFFTDVVSMIEGRGSSRLIRGELVAGKLEQVAPATIVGGTPSVLVSLIGTPYARSVFRKGRWLALEDVNEAPHRLDRMLAHLKLAGILDRCGGLLLGDFHEGENDRTKQVLASLAHILPKRPATPIVVTKDFGHTWPMAPLPIARPVKLHHHNRRIDLAVPWDKLATRPD